jgi:uncharacterized protein (DUF433 family)
MRHDVDSVEAVAFAPSVEEMPLGHGVVRAKEPQAIQIRFAKDRRTFDLERVQTALAIKDKIHLRSGHRAPVEDLVAQIVVGVFRPQAFKDQRLNRGTVHLVVTVQQYFWQSRCLFYYKIGNYVAESSLVSLVVGSVGGGMTVDEVMHEYRLIRAQVLAALTYAAQVVGEERLVPLLP